MYFSHDEAYRIFTVELVTTEPMTTHTELFQDIARKLFEDKVITKINIDNVEAYELDGRQIARFDIHLTNANKPSEVRLTKVKKALSGLLHHHEQYLEMYIDVN